MPAAHRHARHLPAFILLALTDGPLHGHAIRGALHARFTDFKGDPGAIYRTLQALDAAGEVTAHWDTGTRGPARKIYELTPLGWERLGFWETDIRQRLGFLQGFLDGYAKVRRSGRS
ncbi:helix-turn-helix transcriptional regulator [Geothrix sp. SG200]|uniref:PadR family transcriptional regulator n=1 Tax=Geothrix sp. SG200 TaxID=2922865 RepID=UPI001FACB04E|nr:helix-turn-helix transcriptional regulator [Geothrix sp. SG200]